MNENTNNGFFASLGSDILECIKTKWIGCFVGLAAWALTLAQMISYATLPAIGLNQLFNAGVIVCCVIGLIAFPALSLFRKTSRLAPIVLMACDLLCLLFFVSAGGFLDYFSTEFFSGFSMGAFFSLPGGVWFSMLSIILSFVISSVAMYLPQNRKPKTSTADDMTKDASAA